MHLKNKAKQIAGDLNKKKRSLCRYVQQKPLTVSMFMSPWPKKSVVSKSIY